MATNRDLALSHARTVTRSIHGRGVFGVASVFQDFLEADKDHAARSNALTDAIDQRAAFTGTIREAEAIVATATESLRRLNPARSSSVRVTA